VLTCRSRGSLSPLMAGLDLENQLTWLVNQRLAS
jgi:hypothetical protein